MDQSDSDLVAGLSTFGATSDWSSEFVTLTEVGPDLGSRTDSLHRLVQSVNGNNKTVGYAYNLRGLLTTLTYPGGSAVTRGYDNAGRLTSVADWLTHTTTFAYDADSNLTTETYPNGTVGTFTFDAADRISSTVDSLSGTQFLSLTYHRDADGQLTQGSATQQYGYDTINRVNSWTNSGASTSYGYDAADEITGIAGSSSTTLTYDVAGQVGTFVTTSGGNTTQNLSYSFDVQGNRTQVTDNIAHATTTLGYDQANRLKSFGSSATYQYDGNGLRANKVVSGTTTNYAWDVSGGLPLMIVANNTDWIYGPGGVVLEEIVPTNTVYYYHQDQLGSTRKVTDSTGTVVRSYTFDPWGNVSSTSGTLSTPFQFAGQYNDMESGLFYLRARYYETLSAQFIGRDGYVAITRAPYTYSADTPLNATDPTGLVCGSIGFNITAELGIWGIGAADDNTWSAGACTNGDLFMSHSQGAFAGQSKSGVFGAFLGCSPVIAASPFADNANQLKGDAPVGSVNVGTFDRVFSASQSDIDVDDRGLTVHNDTTFSYAGVPIPGLGLGGDASSIGTHTDLASFNVVSWVRSWWPHW